MESQVPLNRGQIRRRVDAYLETGVHENLAHWIERAVVQLFDRMERGDLQVSTDREMWDWIRAFVSDGCHALLLKTSLPIDDQSAASRLALAMLDPDTLHLVVQQLRGVHESALTDVHGRTGATVARAAATAHSEYALLLHDAMLFEVHGQPLSEIGLENKLRELSTFQIAVNPGNGSVEDVRRVLRALNDLHVAAGGLGLEFTEDGMFVTAREAVHA